MTCSLQCNAMLSGNAFEMWFPSLCMQGYEMLMNWQRGYGTAMLSMLQLEDESIWLQRGISFNPVDGLKCGGMSPALLWVRRACYILVGK
jgi:hypothetical protein